MDENLPPVFRTSENNTWKASLQKKKKTTHELILWRETIAYHHFYIYYG